PATTRILFYCHFPDQLLTRRESVLKRLYRAPIDWLEERTTGMAHVVMVNSEFTAGVFRDTFATLRDAVAPTVLYPSLNTKQFDEFKAGFGEEEEEKDAGGVFTFLSINRYERKKNLKLAFEAFGMVQSLS
ncbi:MAG: hypothetical protein AAF525_05625, partial [Pseudomonadota bacterium]